MDRTYEKQGYLNSAFRVFHILDQSKKEFSYHYHDFDKLVIMIQGDVSYSIEGQTYSLKPYDIVLVRHNEIHRPVIHSEKTYERIIVYISPEFINSYKTDSYNLDYCFEKASQNHTSVLRISSSKTHPLFKCIKKLETSFQDNDYASDLYRQVIFLEFMILLNRAVFNDSLDYLHTEISNPKILEIIKYINENLTADLSIDHISEKLFMSKFHMMRTFKNETGYSIGNYIMQKRLILSRQLLLEGIPITQTCYQCGFKDYSNFSRQYKNFFGETPKDTKKSL